MEPWPATPDHLEAIQRTLGSTTVEPWQPPATGWTAAGCFICFARGKSGPGHPGDPGWAAAALVRGDRLLAVATARGKAPAGYTAGLLALREGPLLEEALSGLPERPDVLLVDATGRDHPRRAGLALHLGARLDLPSIGVTHRPLLAQGPWPPEEDGALSPLRLDDEQVGYWFRPRRGVRPLAVHAAWRTGPDVAVAVVRVLCRDWRTPLPLRHARAAAREARAREGR